MDPFGAVDSEMSASWRTWSTLTIPDYSLVKLTEGQRLALLIATIVLLTLALLGNLTTIFFNLRRQIRPLFRACLLSLALSDIITSFFSATTYLSQFFDERTVLWTLGGFLCSATPFLTTMAIIVNSITLVCIAFDRYTAVIKMLKGSWEPTALSCAIGTLIVWAVGAGIASPMFSAYFLIDVSVVETDPKNRSIGIQKYEAQMCINDKSENSSYYGIVFSSVFLPLFVAFLWLNATIASEIWSRRNPLDQQKIVGHTTDGSSGSSSSSNPHQTAGTMSTGMKSTSNTSSSIKSNNNRQTNNPGLDDNTNQSRVNQEDPQAAPMPAVELEATKSRKTYQSSANNCRKTRQLRMFKVIIVIMTTFFVCRLPTWIFLLIKMNTDLTGGSSYVVHFAFGILSLANCAINPFLYTFLSETIRFGQRIKRIFCCSSLFLRDPGPKMTDGNIYKESLWKSVCCFWCEDETELPDDKNLIDYGEDKQMRRKSYNLSGKNPLSCISSTIPTYPFGHYATNVHWGKSTPPLPDPDHFVDVDLTNRK